MVRFYLLSFLLLLALTAVAMISCLSAEARTIRGLPRGLWVVLILLVPLVGPVLYFLFGRPERGGLNTGLPQTPKSRPVAPDDDPDFLYRLGRDRPAPGPHPPGPTNGPRTTDNGRSKGDPPVGDGRSPDGKDGGRSTGDARTKDDQPPSDGGA